METIEERAREYAHQYRRDAHDLKGERADAALLSRIILCRSAMTIERQYIRILPLLKCKAYHGYRNVAKSSATSTTIRNYLKLNKP